jgi:hypothetical protein
MESIKLFWFIKIIRLKNFYRSVKKWF